jgi:beta-galactosidase
VILSAQYYRPPFPNRRYWRDDMQAMRRAGLNTAYLWVCWGWVEPSPGTFNFDDYDELIEEAAAAGLGVVLNTIAEIQPFWVPREIPQAQMIDHLGRPVISSPRGECTVGLTPGGCTDEPQLRAAMGSFLSTVAHRYRSSDPLVAWDLWNETRWAVQADAYVCYCEHTLASFRDWLHGRYGDLDGLSQAWGRRYSSWEDVLPGKLPGRIYTDLMEFAAFLTDRSCKHMRFRYDIVQAADPDHLIVAHAMNTASARVPVEFEQELSRGNDWDYTDFLDGFGASLFPLWFRDTVPDFGARVESARSAAQDRLYWVGELQGSSAHSAIEAQDSVPGDLQQRWLWSAIGRGARAVNFWCWRDEVFSRESGGFGLCGNDGEAPSRLAALRRAGDLLEARADLIDAYRPAPAEVGVIFEPDGYRMDWAQYGTASRQAARSLWGYLLGLEKIQVAYDVVESHHHSQLDRYRLLILPWPLIVSPDLAARLLDWTARGGTLLVESEADSYDARGFYRYPQDRPFAAGLGIVSQGRRANNGTEVAVTLGDFTGRLRTAGWVEPLDPAGGESLADSDLGALAVHLRIGAGHVIALGALAGLAEDAAVSTNVGSLRTSAGAMTGWLATNALAGQGVLPDTVPDPLAPSDFTRFLSFVVTSAGLSDRLRCSQPDGAVVQWRHGRAGDSALLFVINHGPAALLTFSGAAIDVTAGDTVEDLTTGRRLSVRAASPGGKEFDLQVDAGSYAVARWPSAACSTMS